MALSPPVLRTIERRGRPPDGGRPSNASVLDVVVPFSAVVVGPPFPSLWTREGREASMHRRWEPWRNSFSGGKENDCVCRAESSDSWGEGRGVVQETSQPNRPLEVVFELVMIIVVGPLTPSHTTRGGFLVCVPPARLDGRDFKRRGRRSYAYSSLHLL